MTLTATVTGSSPTGTVTFKDGATTLGTGSVSAGKATLSTTFATAGAKSITASYGGNATNTASTSAAVSLAVNQLAKSGTLMTVSPTPNWINQAITLTATVTGANPTGTVAFKDGGTTMATVALSAGKATLNTKVVGPAGNKYYSAYYSGDANNEGSMTNHGYIVKLNPSTTTLTLTPNLASVNQPVTMTATVSGISPTGTVSFRDGLTTLGTGVISAGKATLTTTFTSAGTKSIEAVYAGDTVNASSLSAKINLPVNPVSTTTTLSATPNPVLIDKAVTLVATVTGSNPTGTVTFKNSATTLGTAAVNSGKATLVVNPWSFASGVHSITATYGGNAANASSVSAATSLMVNLNPTTTILSVAPNPVLKNAAAILTATVSGASPSGTVTFKNGTTTLGTAPIVSGKASLTTYFPSMGVQSITASYGGNAANAPSTSAAVNLTVTFEFAAKEVLNPILAAGAVTNQRTTGTPTGRDIPSSVLAIGGIAASHAFRPHERTDRLMPIRGSHQHRGQPVPSGGFAVANMATARVASRPMSAES